MPAKRGRSSKPSAHHVSSTSKDVAPAKAEAEDVRGHQPGHHCGSDDAYLTAPPRIYMDLFMPLLNYFVQGERESKGEEEGRQEREAGGEKKDDEHSNATTAVNHRPTVKRRRLNGNSNKRNGTRAADAPDAEADHIDAIDETCKGEEEDDHKSTVMREKRMAALKMTVFSSYMRLYLEHTHCVGSTAACVSPGKGAHAEDHSDDAAHTNGAHEEMMPHALRTPQLHRLVAWTKAAGEYYLPAFVDDSDYLAAREIVFSVTQWTVSARAGRVSGATLTLLQDARLDYFRDCLSCMSLVNEIVHHHVQSRLRRMSLEPRVMRVCRKLEMSSKEVTALTYLLVCHCGSHLASCVSSPLVPASVAFHARLSPRELLWFLNSARPHMKQGLIVCDLKYCVLVDYKLSIQPEVVAALTGQDLAEEQLIKLEQTALVEVLKGPTGASAEQTTREAAANGENTEKAAQDTTAAAGAGKEAVLPLSTSHAAHKEASEGDEDGEGESTDGSSSSASGEMTLEAVAMAIVSQMEAAGQLGPGEHTNTAKEGEGGASAEATSPCAALPAVTSTSNNTNSLAAPPNKASSTSYHSNSGTAAAGGGAMHTPYTTDIEYMEESFKLLANLIRIRTAEGDIKDEEGTIIPRTTMEATLRELKGRVRVASATRQARIEATRQVLGGFLPRIEQLSDRLHLTELEKQVLLLMVGNVVSHDILVAINGRYVMREGQRLLTVGYILFVLCEGLQERVEARRAFYQSSALISNGILSLSMEMESRSRFNTDLMDYVCDIDRKIVDHVMGIETATSEMVPGSTLYMPTVPMANVVLPRQTTELVLSTIAHYSLFEQCKRQCGFGEGLGQSRGGLVILFYGPSGTGKTMLANAVAHDLKKRLLLVSVAQFKSEAKAPDVMRYLFREAKLSDAILFFDECESLFETREVNPLVTCVLAEFEKNDGMIIMATNKAQNLDEAMNRRISLMVEFKPPDHELRARIWRSHIPAHLTLGEDVCIERLALNYELTGGLIRNAVLAALNSAVGREKSASPTLRMADFESGARQQLRGFFLAAGRPPGTVSESYITPKRSLDELIVDRDTRQLVERIANVVKSRNTLFAQWGFTEEMCEDQGALYLLHGPRGTGKSMAAEGIAYECGVTIRLCNIAELMLTREVNVHGVFAEAKQLGAIIVFDQAQILFNHDERSVQVTQLIQYHAMRYPRPVLVLVTTGGEGGPAGIDVRATRFSFSAEIAFRLPSRALRQELWLKAFPSKVPLAADLDTDALSETVVSAKLIRTVAFNVCCKVALLPPEERQVTMAMLRAELESAAQHERSRHFAGAMFA